MTSLQLSIEKLAAYYESKTQVVLRRYGPGPRVHYHTGMIDEAEPLSHSWQTLRPRLVAAQERMLYYTAGAWRLKSVPHHHLLDVGCGLGGSAIFWAQEFGSNVTAVTIAPSHVNLVEAFASQAGVESLVHPFVCDALQVPGENRFDAAMAIDSSCHLPRQAWFRRVAALLRKGGHVFIADCFLARSEYQAPFNRHWCAQIGTVTEYLDAAREAGFREESVEDISRPTIHFWELTAALIQAEAQEDGPSPLEPAKLAESLAMHALMRRGLVEGSLRYMLLSFTKH